MRMRTFAGYMLALLCMLLAGCWDRTEINDLAIITAAGVDRDDQGDTLLVLQFYTPSGNMQGGIESGGGSNRQSGQAIVRVGQGINISAAVSEMQETSARRYFWGHTQIMMISERLAKISMKEPLEFMTRHSEMPERINVFIIRDEWMQETLKWSPVIERDSAILLQEIGNLKNALQVTLLEWFKASNHMQSALVIPMIQFNKANDSEQLPQVVGAAVIKEQKMVGKMGAEEVRGYRWVHGQLNEATVTVRTDDPDETLSIRFQQIRSRLIPQFSQGKWSITIKIQAKGQLLENNSMMEVSDPKGAEEISALAAEEIRNRIMRLSELAQEEWQADIFGFSQAIRRQDARWWKEHQEDWDAIYARMSVEVETSVTLNHSGLTSKNANIKERR